MTTNPTQYFLFPVASARVATSPDLHPLERFGGGGGSPLLFIGFFKKPLPIISSRLFSLFSLYPQYSSPPPKKASFLSPPAGCSAPSSFIPANNKMMRRQPRSLWISQRPCLSWARESQSHAACDSQPQSTGNTYSLRCALSPDAKAEIHGEASFLKKNLFLKKREFRSYLTIESDLVPVRLFLCPLKSLLELFCKPSSSRCCCNTFRGFALHCRSRSPKKFKVPLLDGAAVRRRSPETPAGVMLKIRCPSHWRLGRY